MTEPKLTACPTHRFFAMVGIPRAFHFRNQTPDFFHHKPSVSTVTDFQPALRDNEDLIGAARSVPVSQDGPRSCPKPIFSAL